MNILRNVRWGYSGDGMACGPCCGFDAVELVVEQEEEKLTFFRLDCMDQYAGVTKRDHSTFDAFIFVNDGDALGNDYGGHACKSFLKYIRYAFKLGIAHSLKARRESLYLINRVFYLFYLLFTVRCKKRGKNTH